MRGARHVVAVNYPLLIAWFPFAHQSARVAWHHAVDWPDEPLDTTRSYLMRPLLFFIAMFRAGNGDEAVEEDDNGWDDGPG